MTGRTLRPVLAALLSVAWTGCSSNVSPRVRESAANGGPEDPAILAVENLGGSCFGPNGSARRLSSVTASGFKKLKVTPS
jgi:hypothetical protein